jgi:hypothetical protein
LYALVEFGHQLEIPDYVLENDTIKQIRLTGVDIILIQNDIISYRKEEVSVCSLECLMSMHTRQDPGKY